MSSSATIPNLFQFSRIAGDESLSEAEKKAKDLFRQGVLHVRAYQYADSIVAFSTSIEFDSSSSRYIHGSHE